MWSDVEDFASQRLEHLRTAFKHAVAVGEARPLVVPWCLIATFVLPVLYLSIPHTNRPWLYRARFLVLAVIMALNLDMMRNTSSTNTAAAYATGLLASWGIIWSLTVLVWMRPQFEAERVERRPKSQAPVHIVSPGRANGHVSIMSSSHDSNGHSPSPRTKRRKSVRFAVPPDVDVAKSLEEYEYYWQSYPTNAPYWTRFDWALDLCLAWRGSGWNWAISSVPSFARPDKPLSNELVKIETIPLASRSGFGRYATKRGFLWEKLLTISLGYMVLDFCAIIGTKDPHFVFGPSATHKLPPHLVDLPPALLSIYRSAYGFAGILAALHMIFSTAQVFQYLFVGPLLSTRGELWHYPTIFGSFTSVLDKGLAGFWGAWWHQTFRVAFAAPSVWLLKHGYLTPGSASAKLACGAIAFVQSSFLHASGSITSLPYGTTKWYMPPLFFLLSCVGIVVQGAFCSVFRGAIEGVPRAGRRAANLVFTAVWLHFTAWAFIDDLSRSAIWLFEPVPVSPLRFLGFGLAGDSWWRWDRDSLPHWHVGRHWWESGLAI